ncbi:MAG: type and secretion system family protein [Rickettsiales bacterium]|jgi:general secretion pathway protein D|nr:type and secretion system family protein [Rickettsiales bacterium]
MYGTKTNISLGILTLVLWYGLLTGCTPSQSMLDAAKATATPQKIHNIHDIPDYIDPAMKLNRDDFTNILLPEKKSETAVKPSLPEIMPILSTPKPTPIGNGKLVTLSVTEDIPLKDVLIELSHQADIDMELDPRISGGIILRVTNKPVEEVIERIARLGQLRYMVKDGVLRIQQDDAYTVNYSASFLNLSRSNTGSVSISTEVLGGGVGGGSGSESGSNSNSSSSNSSSGSGSSSGGGGAGLTSGSQNSITSEYNGDLWAAIASGVGDILAQSNGETAMGATQMSMGQPTPLADPTTPAATVSANQNVSVNRQAGLISVMANGRTHEKIAEYLEKVKRSVSAQVLIEAKVLEVTLNDEYRSGINWSFTDDNLQLSTAGSFVDSLGGQTSLFTLSGLSKTPAGNLEAAINFTQKFGTSRTLSSPRVLATNNQQAVLTFAENQVFFTLTLQEQEEENTTGSTQNTLTVESEMHSVPIGVILSLQPSIDLDNNEITMNVRPTLSRITEHVTDPGTSLIARRNNVSDISSEVPIVEVREMDSVLKIKNGQVMVIGGLMEERSVNEDKGIPGISKIPAIGNLFKSVEKTNEVVETVILIKATIVPGYGVGEHDQKLFKTFTHDPRPAAF